jgi:hypothetical protein
MSILDTLVTDASINDEVDRIGGFQPLESDLYTLTIEHAFVTAAASKALALNVHFKTDDGRQLRSQFWMSSGENKGCKNYYINKQGEKHYLPGFNQANALCLLTVGKEIGRLKTEPKVIPLYDPSKGAEAPTRVEMLTPLLGKTVIAGVIKQIVDKRAKSADTGQYEPTGETRIENEVDKFFRAKDRFTVAEIRAQLKAPEFIDQWKEKWVGETKDKSTGADGVKAGAPLKKREVGKQAPVESLFEDD